MKMKTAARKATSSSKNNKATPKAKAKPVAHAKAKTSASKSKSKASSATARVRSTIDGIVTKGKDLVATGKALVADAMGTDAPKATELLKSQHRKAEKLFAALQSANGNAKDLVHELATDLLAHMVIEEKIFYPAAMSFKSGLVLEGYEEHMVARFALERLLVTSPSDQTFKAKAKTLQDIIESHVEEEEQTLFPIVDKGMSNEENRRLGAKMKETFEATVASGWAKTLQEEGPNVRGAVRRASARRAALA